MSPRKALVQFAGLLCGFALVSVLPGCGKGETAPEEGAAKTDGETQKAAGQSQSGDSDSKKSATPKVAIQGKAPRQAKKIEPPKEGTPRWYIQEILIIRLKKYPETNDVDKLRALRRSRNLKIVELAEECIAKTHKDKDLEQVFNAAVHQLLEARVSLALQGKQQDIIDLYDVAHSLYKRDKKSKAAADAAYRVAAFANTNARRYPDPKNGWLKEFVRRARLFATDFPQDKTRAAQLLSIAGHSCEAHRQTKDAIACYEKLQSQFGDLPQGKRATAILRRLQLTGRPLQLAGPTIDGGFLDVKDDKGKVLLIVFWASDSEASRKAIAALQPLVRKYNPAGLKIIGVNLDREEPVVDSFLEKSKLRWPQVFYPDRAKRRWDNLIAKHYGVRELPTIWLVDRAGIVRDTWVDVKTLDKRLATIFERRASRP